MFKAKNYICQEAVGTFPVRGKEEIYFNGIVYFTKADVRRRKVSFCEPWDRLKTE